MQRDNYGHTPQTYRDVAEIGMACFAIGFACGGLIIAIFFL